MARAVEVDHACHGSQSPPEEEGKQSGQEPWVHGGELLEVRWGQYEAVYHHA